ncbi:MAG: FAD synthetase family protein [Simkaniaceae bacterium]|nr:FAD synthetase family protein [Simkaniaceae bacterium]
MKVVTSLSAIPPLTSPVTLAIGTFDGMHTGHQAIIDRLKRRANERAKTVVTFSNHPSSVLCPGSAPPFLISLEHRLLLMEKSGIDLAIVLPFTESFALQTHDRFLETLRKKLPFDALVLGEEATFGRNREGNPSRLLRTAERLGFSVERPTTHRLAGEAVSSSLIRSSIERGRLRIAERYLGRPYSIGRFFDPVAIREENVHTFLWQFETEGLCLPPEGGYSADFRIEGVPQALPALALVTHPTGAKRATIRTYFTKRPETGAFATLSFLPAPPLFTEVPSRTGRESDG